MSAIPAPSPEREQRLDDVIALYLEALEAGEPLARSDLEKAHPDLADELALFFANQDHVARLTAPLRDATTAGNAHRQTFPRRNFSDLEGAATVPFSSRDRTPEGAAAECPDSPDRRIQYFGDYE